MKTTGYRKCEHYRENTRENKFYCAKGVDIFELVGGDPLGWKKKIPCYEANNSKVFCQHLVYYPYVKPRPD